MFLSLDHPLNATTGPQHDDNQECPLGGRTALMSTIWVKGHCLKFGKKKTLPIAQLPWWRSQGFFFFFFKPWFELRLLIPFVALCTALSCLGGSEVLALGSQHRWELWRQEAHARPELQVSASLTVPCDGSWGPRPPRTRWEAEAQLVILGWGRNAGQGLPWASPQL